LAVSRRPTVEYVPDVYPVFSDTAEEAPPLPNAPPIESRQVQQDEHHPSVNQPEPFIISVTPEPERVNEPPAKMVPIIPVAPEPTVPDKRPVTAEPEVPPVIAAEEDPTIPTPVGPSGQDEPDVPVSVPPALPGPVAPVEQSEPSFGDWSSILSEIKQRIEPLASGTLQRLSQLNKVCV
jgi:hypothetical protein